ncbi:MAG: hypothetical protein R2856_35055 [Caldilineaceae bacterium]
MARALAVPCRHAASPPDTTLARAVDMRMVGQIAGGAGRTLSPPVRQLFARTNRAMPLECVHWHLSAQYNPRRASDAAAPALVTIHPCLKDIAQPSPATSWKRRSTTNCCAAGMTIHGPAIRPRVHRRPHARRPAPWSTPPGICVTFFASCD